MKNMHHMNYECKKPNKDALKEYQDFMCNPKNEYNCNDCPERGISSTGHPCGQQNCWVTCHCGEGSADNEG